MADGGGWGGRQQASRYPSSSGMMKRPRTDYDLPPSQMAPRTHIHDYLARGDDWGGQRVAKDSEILGSAYDRYLRSTQMSSFAQGDATTFSRAPMGSGISVGEQSLVGRPGPSASEVAVNGRGVRFGSQLPVDILSRSVRDTLPLPPDASNTIYVEGLPSNCTKREVAHIFRPFVGYREVRLVIKDTKHRGGDPLILCFVDFADAACAATALSALHGYRMDEDDRGSSRLRIQFSRNPNPRSGTGSHGRR